jgi:hypothetical protein
MSGSERMSEARGMVVGQCRWCKQSNKYVCLIYAYKKMPGVKKLAWKVVRVRTSAGLSNWTEVDK